MRDVTSFRRLKIWGNFQLPDYRQKKKFYNIEYSLKFLLSNAQLDFPLDLISLKTFSSSASARVIKSPLLLLLLKTCFWGPRLCLISLVSTA